MGGHTPGRWEAVDGVLSGEHILILAGDYAIAKVYVEEEGSEKINRANARLIAAAPDLLAALEGMVQLAAGNFDTSPLSDEGAALAPARAAIARTKTGEGE